MTKINNDGDLYNCYKDYTFKVELLTTQSGIAIFTFPNHDRKDLTTGFIIHSTGSIKFNDKLPEFILKEVAKEIRRQVSEYNQYLWGV